MSDGPHKSLPMRPRWKNVAECGDNHSFASEEISRAIIPALEQDCSSEISPGLLNSIRNLFLEQDTSLFKHSITPQLDALRSTAGCGMGRALLDHAIQTAEKGGTGIEGLVKATTNALVDRAARGARQVEEHYCRKSSSTRAQRVRNRIEQGVNSAPIGGLARQVLKLDSRPFSARSLKQKGLDDGVKL
jgi:hypothetical protein